MNSEQCQTMTKSRAAAFAVLAFLVLLVGIATPTPAQTVNALNNFASNANSTAPIFPQRTMAPGRDGDFHGISQMGNGCCQGIVYKMSSTRSAHLSARHAFTVKSDTQITVTVPAGATPGKIVVFTKGGSVLSATSFTVN